MMLRYLLPRLVAALVFGLLVVYFLYREFDDPWLFPGDRVESAAPATVDPVPHSDPVPPPAPPPAPEVDFERRLLETHAALASAMERRLAHQLENVEGQFADQSDRMAAAQTAVGTIAQRLRDEQMTVADELNRVLQTMEDELRSFDGASGELDTAHEAWTHAFRQLSLIGEIAGDALMEENYDFKIYQVGPNETLARITRQLEREYDLTGTDLRTLIELFNNVETRQRTAVGRRGTSRVVVNPELRIPIPKGAGGMIDDSGLSGILMHQRAAINRARDRQAHFNDAIHNEIGSLRAFVGQIEQLEALAHDLEESLTVLDPADLSYLQDATTPDQRLAWERFNQAFDAYARLDSRELRGEGARQLEAAMRDLVDAYTAHATTVIPDPERADEDAAADDFEWFRQYLDRYDPTPTGPHRSTGSPPAAESTGREESSEQRPLDDTDWIDAPFDP